MTSPSFVTVILTSYNHQDFIAKSIESVLNQTFVNFELIIFDDFSADKSWEIINSYSKRNCTHEWSSLCKWYGCF